MLLLFRYCNAVCASEECEQDVAANVVQSMPQDQCETGRDQQHFGANDEAKNIHRTGHFHRRGRYTSTSWRFEKT